MEYSHCYVRRKGVPSGCRDHADYRLVKPNSFGYKSSSRFRKSLPMTDRTTPAKKQADRFARAREKQSRALLEDYAELIGDLIAELGEARVADIAERMGVAQPTATKAISRLKREGLATARPYRGVFLTDDGADLADRVRARHRTVAELLIAVGVPEDVAEIDAEGIEHHVSRRTLSAFEAFLKAQGSTSDQARAEDPIGRDPAGHGPVRDPR